MAGQWTMPHGGLPGAGMAGLFAAQRFCINEGIEFKTSDAENRAAQSHKPH